MGSTVVSVEVGKSRQVLNAPAQAPSSVFAALPSALGQSLKSNSGRVSLKTDEVLFFEGDVDDRLYWVIGGVLKATAMSPNGAERIIAMLGPGAVFGESTMLNGGPRSKTVRAIRPSELRFVSRERFHSLLRTDPALLQQFLDTLVRRLRRANEEVVANVLPIKVRVARALFEMMDLLGEEENPAGTAVVTRHLRQTDIAALAGVSRESVTRVIASLKKQGLLKQLSRFSFLIDRVRLDREAHPAPWAEAASRHSALQRRRRMPVRASA